MRYNPPMRHRDPKTPVEKATRQIGYWMRCQTCGKDVFMLKNKGRQVRNWELKIGFNYFCFCSRECRDAFKP